MGIPDSPEYLENMTALAHRWRELLYLRPDALTYLAPCTERPGTGQAETKYHE